MSRLTLFLLGSPRVECDSVPMKKVDTRKAIALLAYLAINHNSYSRDSIINLLWPEFDESRARTALRHTLYVLNQSLEGDWLEVDRKSIGLNPDADIWLDVDEFHSYLAECGSHGHELGKVCPKCIKPLSDAVELYQGDFLSGFSLKDSVNIDDWQFSLTQSLRSEVTSGLERLVGLLSGEGEYEKGIGYSKRWLEIDRADERAHRHLMELYARTGQRPAALRQYEECVRILEKELSETPKEETVRLYQAIQENVSPPEREVAEVSPIPKPPDTPKHNLPRQLTSFIGRKGEIEEVKRLLSTTYLLTLTGSGGCGKTRLCLEVAANLVEEYEDGVWLVELASLSDPALVPQEVASTLDVSEQPDRSFTDTLSDYLKSKQILILLDNCEHLIEACATLAETLLRSCPNLKVIAASREALGIAGESAYRVPSLSLPDPGNLPPVQNLAGYESVNLFVDRAVAAESTFTMTVGNTPAVAQICHRLDGIPLAIELAAAPVKALSVEQILARLDDRFRLLTGGSRTALPRQQTLRATIDWSYDLLSEKERVLFKRLSVFMGGWSLEAAEAICVGGGIEEYEVLELLMGLVDKSLLVAEKRNGDHRYSLLETVRQYARDKLLDSGEGEGFRDRHLDWFLGFAEQAEPELRGPDQVEWMDRLEVEHDNLRAALEWSLGSGGKREGDYSGSDDPRSLNAERGLRLAGALMGFWYTRGYYNEGYQWLEESLSGSGRVEVSERTKSARTMSARAKALWGAAAMLYGKSDYKRSEALGEESLALYQELGDKQGAGSLLMGLGLLSGRQGDYVRARELRKESLSLFREMGDRQGIADALAELGSQASGQGDHEQAIALIEESLALNRELANKGRIRELLQTLGHMVLKRGDHKRAKELIEESLDLSRELGDKRRMASSYYFLGLVALVQEDHDQATGLLKLEFRQRYLM